MLDRGNLAIYRLNEISIICKRLFLLLRIRRFCRVFFRNREKAGFGVLFVLFYWSRIIR